MAAVGEKQMAVDTASGDVQKRGGQPLLAVRSSQMIRGRTLRSAACS